MINPLRRMGAVLCATGVMWTMPAVGGDRPEHLGPLEASAAPVIAPWRLSTTAVRSADSWLFAGQPDAQGFVGAARAGVTAVLNIRQPQEVDWDVAAAAEAAGIRYANVPLDIGPQGVDQASVAAIEAQLAQWQDQVVLIHCASGNRVALWWALHLAQVHGLDVETSIALAQQAGMRPILIPLLQSQLDKTP